MGILQKLALPAGNGIWLQPMLARQLSL